MTTASSRQNWTRYGVIFSVGFFALAAQVLLFRAFLTVYEGNELGLGVFFCSWLFWGAAGAMAGRWRRLHWDPWIERFAFAPLLLVPAFILQMLLILNARSIAGVASYEIFPFARMLPAAWLGNAPVGLVSGLLFTLACAWVARDHAIPVARVFVVEAVGSFVGGVLVTVLLGVGVAEITVAVWVALVMALATLAAARPRWAAAVPVAILMVVLVGGLDDELDRAIDRRAWTRFLPATSLEGAFTTPHGKYLYGSYQDQFQVVAWESIADTVPGTEHASQVIATHLAQHPHARRFLVFGHGGYGICRRLPELATVEHITWLDPDPSYPAKLLTVLPDAFQTEDERLIVPGTDMQRFLGETESQFDLVILNLPPVTSLALNRFSTIEFFGLIRERLAEEGVVGIRVPGGDNVMGDELVNMGATTYQTLLSVFEEVAIKPGDETWLLASDGRGLLQDPVALRDRFAAIPGAAAIYPPEAVPDLYSPDRVAFQLEHYQQAVAADANSLLLNSDRRPRALLHSLLFATREAGASGEWSTLLRALAAVGAPLAPLVIGFLVVLRMVFLQTGSRRYGTGPAQRGHVFDWYVMVAGAGAVSMALSIILMFIYQSRYGSLFLNVGLVSALFMVGMAVGGQLAVFLVSSPLQSRAEPMRLLWITVLVHLGLLAVVHWTSAAWPEWLFGGLFLAAGLLSGVYLPLAAAVLKEKGLADQAAGGGLAWSDDLGGAVAGTLTGLVLLPIFGSGYSIALLAWLLLALLLPFALRTRVAVGGVRPMGYALFGVAGVMMCASVLLARAETRDDMELLDAALREMAPDETFELKTGAHPHFAGEEGFCFASDTRTERSGGYGGPMTLAVLTDREGVLRDFRVLRSHETPAYLELVGPWMKGLVGRNLFESPALVDGVSGATLTSLGIQHTLDEAGLRFVREVLHQETQTSASGQAWPDVRLVVLAGLAGIALWLRRRPARQVRRLFLVVVVLVMGLWLNVQYSMAHVLALLGLDLPPAGLSLAFAVMVGVPLLVLLVGNVYCGYLCPFGALQELIGDLRKSWLRSEPDAYVWRWGRMVKWGILFLLVLLFALGRNGVLASVDPLVAVFRHDSGGTFAVVIVGLLALSFFYPRFWCRNLCPAGAFLSLLNGVQFLRRFLPPVTHKQCSFGVTGKHDLDCLTCDRCRRVSAAHFHALKPPPSKTAGLRNLVFAVAVGVFALSMLQQAYSSWRPVSSSITVSQVDSTDGEARPVDLRGIRWRIEQGELSEREALFYGPVGGGTTVEEKETGRPIP